MTWFLVWRMQEPQGFEATLVSNAPQQAMLSSHAVRSFDGFRTAGRMRTNNDAFAKPGKWFQ